MAQVRVQHPRPRRRRARPSVGEEARHPAGAALRRARGGGGESAADEALERLLARIAAQVGP